MRPIDADKLLRDIPLKVCIPCPFGEEKECRDCVIEKVMEMVDDAPTVELASPWHRVEDGLPEMSEIVPGYVCSKILVLYDAESGHMDIGYVREKPDGVDWIWGEPFKNPTQWMPIEPPKEEADANK